MEVFRKGYRADSRSDVDALVAHMRALPQQAQVVCLMVMHEAGLMSPPLTMRLGLAVIGAVAWVRRRDRRRARFVMWRTMFIRDPSVFSDLWAQACRHVERGRDRIDPRSVGGWCQGEVDAFLAGAGMLDELLA